MKELFFRFVREDDGQDLIEYVLIASFVSVGALAGATALGTELNTWYQAAADWVTSNAGSFAGGG
jgi:pilus assembly protein Flp/PilA